jgi:DNA gyrase/topoisomerase IV subunit B
MAPKPPSHVVSLFAGETKNTNADAVLTHMANRAAAKTQRFEKVFDAIESRDIVETSWELLNVAIQDIAETGATKLGRTTLMELVRNLTNVAKSMPPEEEKSTQLLEVQSWLRKKAE